MQALLPANAAVTQWPDEVFNLAFCENSQEKSPISCPLVSVFVV